MRAINLYSVSREMDKEIKPLFEKALSDRESAIKIRDEEIGQIRQLVDVFLKKGVENYCFEDWFYSFSIPQIGKEFDLIKIGSDNVIVNIELKSQEVSLERIRKQLVQNRHYFSHIANKIYSFTFMNCGDEARIYRFEGDEIRGSDFDELIETVKNVKVAVNEKIETLFRPGNYLISPLNTPEKYLEGKYYLTNLQEIIKEKIISSLASERGLWGISGAAGTGKTLLLYDLVRKLSDCNKILIVHCGVLNEGHRYISSHLENVTIVSASELTYDTLNDCDIVCVDETQRLDAQSLDRIILKAFEMGKIRGCIFSCDEYQTLSVSEMQNDIYSRLKELDCFNDERLTDRIRTNREVNWFIRNLLSLRDRAPKFFDFNNIDVVYANNQSEADRLIDFYRSRDYVYIDYTPDSVSGEKENILNSHTVIGQEFDNVVMVIDDNFYYNKKGELQGVAHPGSDHLYLKMFYQNVTRAREKLCIVVVNNMDVFGRVVDMLNTED